MSTSSDSPDNFISDLKPYLARKSIVYADVGAHKGDVFRAFCESGLVVEEAHLFEPNPVSFKVLEKTAQEVFKRHSMNLHHTAVGERSGVVRMRAADTMTKVLGESGEEGKALDEGDNNVFTVRCVTLDSYSDQFTDGRLSVLKIDVEGFEAEVLRGAADLLGNQKVDVVYIEAGLNPEGTQQTYYRVIDDLMLGYGYRIFRIYEQKNEWMEDSPFLRRMNLAYFSQHFADKHPYKLTHELYKEQQRVRAVKASPQPKHSVEEGGKSDGKMLANRAELRALQEQLEAERMRHATEQGRLAERARFFEELWKEQKEELEQMRRGKAT